MVTLNLTLFIEVGLFLLFMWAMHRLVIRPLLEVMDGRDDKLAEDRSVAKDAGAEATQLEKQYLLESSRIHREASRDVVRAHRQAQEAHLARLAERKQVGEGELDAVRHEVHDAIVAQSKQFDALSAELANAMAAKLGGKGTAA